MIVRSYLKLIDKETSGNRYDVTPLFADPEAFRCVVRDLAEPFQNAGVTHVACIDALGFILGTGVALDLKAGIVPIRKGGKLPVAADVADFIDYTGHRKSLELRRGVLGAQHRVLVVDEWSETGAQLQTAISLVEGQEATVAGVAAIQIEDCEVTRSLGEKYQMHSLGPV